jgi:polyisoprenoid-binding protein YceI
VITAIATTTTYSIDKAHSEVAFQVRHLLTKVRGRFSEFKGTIEYEEEDPERSSVNLEVQAASIDTSQRDRDAHLRSADFSMSRRSRRSRFAARAFSAVPTTRSW